MTVWKRLPEQPLYALRCLNAAGFEAALVGGCVRDTLLGRTPGDYDITTAAMPEQTLKVFAGDRVIPTGLKHGTVTVLRDGMPLEITTFRVDGTYTDSRHPDAVTFTRSLREDIIRRDFTMNALAWEPDAGLIDYVGGEEDIRRRLIRAVGDPERRFTEDALRILRAVRFSAQLGFAIESETERQLHALRSRISGISAERVYVECCKTLYGPFGAQALQGCEDILAVFLPAVREIDYPTACRRLAAMSAESALPERWAAFLADAGEDAITEALRSLKADNASVASAAAAVREAGRVEPTLYSVRTVLGDSGAETARAAVRIRYAFAPDTASQCMRLLDTIEREDLPCSLRQLAVGGRELAAVGLRGVQIGQTLNALLDDVRADRVPNEKEPLLLRAKTLL